MHISLTFYVMFCLYFYSGCSGLVSAVLGTPADVMKTRIMNQPYINGRGTIYSSTLDCLIKTVSTIWSVYTCTQYTHIPHNQIVYLHNTLPMY